MLPSLWTANTQRDGRWLAGKQNTTTLSWQNLAACFFIKHSLGSCKFFLLYLRAPKNMILNFFSFIVASVKGLNLLSPPFFLQLISYISRYAFLKYFSENISCLLKQQSMCNSQNVFIFFHVTIKFYQLQENFILLL